MNSMHDSLLRTGILVVAVLALMSLALPPARGSAFPVNTGETLNYDLTWTIFPAGTVSASLRGNEHGAKGEYTIVTTAHSQGFVSLLYNVEDEFRSFFDPQTMCSARISKKINEGRRQKETEIVFDSHRKLAILDERDLTRPKTPPKHAENEAPPCVEDVVTAFYYLRGQNMQLGKSLRLPVNDGSRTYDVSVEVQAREKVQTPLGTRSAIRVEPKVFSGLFKRKGRMLIWFSDDDQRLPLRIKFITALGPITGTLRSVTHSPAGTSSAK